MISKIFGERNSFELFHFATILRIHAPDPHKERHPGKVSQDDHAWECAFFGGETPDYRARCPNNAHSGTKNATVPAACIRLKGIPAA